jgi:hypothetical protein
LHWCARLDSNQHCSPPQGDASCRLGYTREIWRMVMGSNHRGLAAGIALATRPLTTRATIHCHPLLSDRRQALADPARVIVEPGCRARWLIDIGHLPQAILALDLDSGAPLRAPRASIQATARVSPCRRRHWKLRSCTVMGRCSGAGWRKRQESNLQDLAVRTVFKTGPLANGVCASMLDLSELGAPSWIRTSNLRLLRAAPLPDWTTGAACGLDDARQARAGDKLSDNSASYSSVGIGSPVGPWPRI